MLSGKIITTIKKSSLLIWQKIVELEATQSAHQEDNNSKLSSLTSDLSSLKNDFTSWVNNWTSARASKIDTIENRLSNSRANKLDNLNRPLDAIETAVNTKASQTSVDAVKSFVDDLEGRLTSTRAGKLDNLNTTVSSRASQTSVDEIKKLLVPNREFKYFYKSNLTGSSLNRDITLVDINGKSGEFLGLDTYISETDKTINATIKIIIDGITVVDIDYRQASPTPSGYQGSLSLLIAPLESLRGGSYTEPAYTRHPSVYIFLNLNNRRLTRADGYRLERDVKGILPIDKIPFNRSLKIIVSSNTKIDTLKASCYINK